MEKDELFIRRSLDLAYMGTGYASPNPVVGAVIVHNNTIIGEGYHKKYGGPHAEVNAVNSIPDHLKYLLPESTIYVSLEPCCFYGKTPACTDLILKNKIPKVVISALDNTPKVDGKGVKILREAGVEVTVGVLAEKGNQVNRFRSIIAVKDRPYIILKYAQTQNTYFAPAIPEQFWITNPYTKRLVHKWRYEIDAILIGTRTASIDNPHLTNRLYYGKSPIRVIIDKNLSLSPQLNIFNSSAKTILVTEKEQLPPQFPNHINLLNLDFSFKFVEQLSKKLLSLHNIGILMIEGGTTTIQNFIDQEIWDEARVFTGNQFISNGLTAPTLNVPPTHDFKIHDDRLTVYFHKC